MREIKFRGKTVLAKLPNGKKIHGKFVYGDLFTGHGMCNILVPVEGGFENYNVDSDTVGQYIGLKDRNGEEIYEGDLLRTVEGDIMGIGTRYITRCVAPIIPGKRNTNAAAFLVSEIAGNIWDNPQLWEDSK